MSNILFYSNYCSYSRHFISSLEKTGNALHFSKVCVDRDALGNRNQLIKKFNIKEVPSIVISGKVYPGKEAFNWLDNTVKGVPSRYNTRAMKEIPRTEGGVQTKRYVKEGVPYGRKRKTTIDTLVKVLRFKDRPEKLNEIHMNSKGSKCPPLPSAIKPILVQKGDKLREKQSQNTYNKLMAQYS